MDLAAAHRAHLAGDAETALTLVRDAWRAIRDPRLGRLVEALGADLAARSPRAPLPGGRGRAAHAEWIAVASADDAADLERLLAVLVSGTSPQAAERLGCLGADPRIASWLLRTFDRPPFSADTTRPFWRVALKCLDELAPPAAAAGVAAMASTYVSRIPTQTGEWIGRSLVKVAAQLGAARAPAHPDSDGLARLEAALDGPLAAFPPSAPPAPPGPSEAELVAAVLAEPAADGPRRVLQDFLLERGDPLGELLALQFARFRPDRDPLLPPEAPTTERERALVRELHLRLLGQLAAAVHPPVLERGFPASVRLWRTKTALPKAVGLPQWRTVTHLGVNAWPEPGHPSDARTERALREIVTHPELVSLRVLQGIPVRALAAVLDQRAVPLRGLAVRGGRADGTLLVDCVARLPTLEGLHLTLGRDEAEEGVAGHLLQVQPLRHLGLTTGLPIGWWLARLGRALPARLVHTRHLGGCILTLVVSQQQAGAPDLHVHAAVHGDKPYPTSLVVAALDGITSGAVGRVVLSADRSPDPFTTTWFHPVAPDDEALAAVARRTG